MAIWQYDLYLIPQSSVDQNLELPATIANPELKRAWDDVQPPAKFFETLDEILEEFESWDDGLRWWGSEDGDRIDVWSMDGRITEVLFRIDVRFGVDIEILKEVLITATLWKCLLWSPESGVLFPPDPDELLKRLAECDAEIFMMDLEKRLRDRAQQDEDLEES